MKMGESNSRLAKNLKIFGLKCWQICKIWNNVHTSIENIDQSSCAMHVILFTATSKRRQNVLTKTSHIMLKACAPAATKRYTTKWSQSLKNGSIIPKKILRYITRPRRTLSIKTTWCASKIPPKVSRSNMEKIKSEKGIDNTRFKSSDDFFNVKKMVNLLIDFNYVINWHLIVNLSSLIIIIDHFLINRLYHQFY